MTSENDASLSSTPTEILKPWRDVARLGQLLLKELHLDQTNRVLDRWLAHRIAELMQRAEAATDPSVKEAAEKECQDLIVRLWDMRDRWPRGSPLREILPTLHKLLERSAFTIRWAGKPDEPEVGGVITKLLRAQRQELRQLCELVKSYMPASAPTIKRLQQLLDEYQKELSEDEITSIKLVINPSSLPIFNTEDETDAYGVTFVGNEEEDEVKESQQTPFDEYADFERDVLLRRDQLLTSVSELLRKSNPNDSNS